MAKCLWVTEIWGRQGVLKTRHEGGTEQELAIHKDISCGVRKTGQRSSKVRCVLYIRTVHNAMDVPDREKPKKGATHLRKPRHPLRDFPLNYHSSSNINHDSVSSKPDFHFSLILAILCGIRWQKFMVCLCNSELPGKYTALRKQTSPSHWS